MKLAVSAALVFVAVASTNFVSVSGRPSETETNTNINTNNNRDINIIQNFVLNELINALINLQRVPPVDADGRKIGHQLTPTGARSGAIVKRSTNTNINTNSNGNTNIIEDLILNEVINALQNLQINSGHKIGHQPTPTDVRGGVVVPRSTNTNINTNSNSNTNVNIVELINVIIDALLNVDVQALEQRKLGQVKGARQ